MSSNSVSSINQLAIVLADADTKVVWITGAGVSVSSGIQPYRGTKDAIWSTNVKEWGTVAKFLKEPKIWWNKYWLRTHEKPEYTNAQPNETHKSLAKLIQLTNSKLVTQNIDHLHVKAARSIGGENEYLTQLNNNIIEVHGRLGLYRCLSPKCIYFNDSYYQSPPAEFLNDWISDEHVGSCGRFEDGSLIIEPPQCPGCINRRGQELLSQLNDHQQTFNQLIEEIPTWSPTLLPLALFFDESYSSHRFYQWSRATSWFDEADVFVFAGTSFSVGITMDALDTALENNTPIFNINKFAEGRVASLSYSGRLTNVLGESDSILPQLEAKVRSLAGNESIRSSWETE